MCSFKRNPFPEPDFILLANGSPLLHEEGEAGRKKKERRAIEVVNSFQQRKPFSALQKSGLLLQPCRHISTCPLQSSHVWGLHFCLGSMRLSTFFPRCSKHVDPYPSQESGISPWSAVRWVTKSPGPFHTRGCMWIDGAHGSACPALTMPGGPRTSRGL